MGIFSGAANIAATAMTNAANKDIAEMTNANQLQIWREQQAHDLDMWNRQNQYNDPREQMARLQSAGVNPLLFASSGSPGNAITSAGGQTPPQLNAPTMQSPQIQLEDTVSLLSQAYKNVADANKAKSDTESTNLLNDQTRKMMLDGYNPELIKSQILLEQYNKLHKENKFIEPYMEKQLQKLGSEIDVNKMTLHVRKQECNQLKESTRSLKLTNDFNADAFPKQLEKLNQEILSIIQERKNSTALASAQVNQANASTNLLDKQAEQTEATTQGINEENVLKQYRASLAKLGINPDGANVPFFMGLAVKLKKGEITTNEVSELFHFLVQADRVGWNKIAKSSANLTRFQMLGNKAGLFGSGINLPDFFTQFFGKFNPAPPTDSIPNQ